MPSHPPERELLQRFRLVKAEGLKMESKAEGGRNQRLFESGVNFFFNDRGRLGKKPKNRRPCFAQPTSVEKVPPDSGNAKHCFASEVKPLAIPLSAGGRFVDSSPIT